MIYEAINHLVGELNQFFRRSSIAAEDIVVLSNPVEPDGRTEPHVASKVIVFLAGIERDSTSGRGASSLARPDLPPACLNIYLMVAANYSGKNYGESLKYISDVIGFFQRHPVFDRQAYPAMDSGIEKLILDMENLDRRELNNIWGMFGGKYIPSVLYRIRMLPMDADIISRRLHTVTDPTIRTGIGRAN
jgi:hypothetical protein